MVRQSRYRFQTIPPILQPSIRNFTCLKFSLHWLNLAIEIVRVNFTLDRLRIQKGCRESFVDLEDDVDRDLNGRAIKNGDAVENIL
jgi:hypothetical protein